MLLRLPCVLPSARLVALACLLGSAGVTVVRAEAQLEARYSVSLLGVPLGYGSWVVDVGDDTYTMAVNAQVSGLMKAFSSGDGAAAVQGAIQNGRVSPSAYVIHIKSRNKVDEVRMAFAGGVVKQLVVEPPVEPKHDTVPLTEAHKRGVVDPISMGLIPGAGANGLSPDACDRKVAAFDGRIRFDLALTYKRMEVVKTEKGYEGPALVCGTRFIPIAGHETGRQAIKSLRDARDIEIWYAPVVGTKFIAMYRISVPTMLGTAVLQATRFVSTVKAARTGVGTPKTQ
jgi:hypothetical protein